MSVKNGSMLIISGLLGLMLSITLLNNYLIIGSVCVLVELIGVGIIIRNRWVNNQLNKLIIPSISIVLILSMLFAYLLMIKNP
ncbi:MAG: hypothetical protein AAF600_20910 [Bacteroidota bacterium]